MERESNAPAQIPNVVSTSPLEREKNIYGQLSPFGAIITLTPLILPPGQQCMLFRTRWTYSTTVISISFLLNPGALIMHALI